MDIPSQHLNTLLASYGLLVTFYVQSSLEWSEWTVPAKWKVKFYAAQGPHTSLWHCSRCGSPLKNRNSIPFFSVDPPVVINPKNTDQWNCVPPFPPLPKTSFQGQFEMHNQLGYCRKYFLFCLLSNFGIYFPFYPSSHLQHKLQKVFGKLNYLARVTSIWF